MNKKQQANYESDLRARNFMTRYDTELSLVTTYAAIKALFDNTLEELEISKQKQFDPTQNITTEKELAKVAMAECVYKNSNIATVQAYGLNKPELVTVLDKTQSYYLNCTDDDALGRARTAYQLMDTNKATLTEIKPADFTGMDEKIIAFDGLKSMPTDSIKSRKALGTDPIPGYLDSLEVDKKMVGKIVESYLATKFIEWQDEIKIGEPLGSRKLSIGMHYTDEMTGVDLSKIKISISNGVDTVVKYTTVRGWLHVYSLTSGNYTITAELPTYQNNVKTNVGVNEDGPVYLEFVMKKIAI